MQSSETGTNRAEKTRSVVVIVILTVFGIISAGVTLFGLGIMWLIVSIICSVPDTSRGPEGDPDAKYAADVDHPARSPSGKYQLNVRRILGEKPQVFEFDIWRKLPTGGFEKVCTLDKRCSIYHTAICAWDQKDRVWIYDGDLSESSMWAFDGDEKWQRRGIGNVPVPAIFLRDWGGGAYQTPNNDVEKDDDEQLENRLCCWQNHSEASGPSDQAFQVFEISTRPQLLTRVKERLAAAAKSQEDNDKLIGLYSDVATIQEGSKNYKDAESALDCALKLCSSVGEGERPFPDKAEVLLQLGRVSAKLGRGEHAERLLTQAVELERKNTGSTSGYTKWALDSLAQFYKEQGKFEKADQIYQSQFSAK